MFHCDEWSTYPVEARNSGEVLQRGELADVQTDHLEQGELLQVVFVLCGQILNGDLVQNQVVELQTSRRISLCFCEQGKARGQARSSELA